MAILILIQSCWFFSKFFVIKSPTQNVANKIKLSIVIHYVNNMRCNALCHSCMRRFCFVLICRPFFTIYILKVVFSYSKHMKYEKALSWIVAASANPLIRTLFQSSTKTLLNFKYFQLIHTWKNQGERGLGSKPNPIISVRIIYTPIKITKIDQYNGSF